MYISKLILQNFGKFHNKQIELKPGINLVYGPNESGKTTIKEFIIGMLYGIEKSRGVAARLDNYELRKPIDCESFNGIMNINTEGKEYIIYRNFIKSNKWLKVNEVETGREVRLGKKGLLDKMVDMDKNTYLDTICVGQKGAGTTKDLADTFNNYLVNMSNTRTTDMDSKKALDYLKEQKKIYDIKSLNEELDNLIARRQDTSNIQKRLVDIREETKILEQKYDNHLKKITDNIGYKDYNAVTQYTDGETDVLTYRGGVVNDKSKRKKTQNPLFITLASIVLLFLLEGLIYAIPFPFDKQYLVYGTIVLMFLAVIVGFVRLSRYKKKLIDLKNEELYRREKYTVDKSISMSKKKNNIAEDEEVNEIPTIDNHTEVEIAREYTVKLAALRSEEEDILRRIAENADDETNYYRIKNTIDSYTKELQAIDKAMETIASLSESIYDSFGVPLNSNVSRTISYITDGKYDQVKLDEKLKISVRHGDSFVGIDYLSAGTIEQIYLAVRMGVAKMLGKKQMPIIVDDIFGAYDESRLFKTLSLLEDGEQEQIIIFTANVHIGDMLDDLSRDYNYVEL